LKSGEKYLFYVSKEYLGKNNYESKCVKAEGNGRPIFLFLDKRKCAQPQLFLASGGLIYRGGGKPVTEQNWQQVEEWMALYGDRILRMVFLIVDDLHQAEEIAQDVFIKAFENAGNFRGESSPYTWLYRIALNCSRDILKRRRRWRLERWGEDPGLLAAAQPPPESLEEQAARRETGRKIRHCISRLPLRYREVIILYYYDDLKISDIARVLEQPEGTVKSHLARGRSALEKLMRKEGLAYVEGR